MHTCNVQSDEELENKEQFEDQYQEEKQDETQKQEKQEESSEKNDEVKERLEQQDDVMGSTSRLPGAVLVASSAIATMAIDNTTFLASLTSSGFPWWLFCYIIPFSAVLLGKGAEYYSDAFLAER